MPMTNNHIGFLKFVSKFIILFLIYLINPLHFPTANAKYEIKQGLTEQATSHIQSASHSFFAS